MSQLVRLEGKHTTQNAHCALQASVALSLEKEEDKADLGHGTRAQVVKVNACFYLGK